MERAIEQTFHHKLQLRYRGFSDVNNEAMKLSSVPSSPSPDDTNSNLNSIPKKQPIESLFQFNCNMTTGRPVNCLCWHKVNKHSMGKHKCSNISNSSSHKITLFLIFILPSQSRIKMFSLQVMVLW